MARRERCGLCDPEALREDRAHALDLHLAEAGERLEAALQLVRALGLVPEPAGVAAVLVDHVLRELLDALRHRAGKAVDCRLLAKERLEIRARHLLRVERAEPLLDLQRA